MTASKSEKQLQFETEDGQLLQVNEYTKDVSGVRQVGEQGRVRFDPMRIAVIDPATDAVVSAIRS